MNNGATWVGAFTTAFMGIVVVASIYQLGTNASDVTTAATSISNNTLNNLFK